MLLVARQDCPGEVAATKSEGLGQYTGDRIAKAARYMSLWSQVLCRALCFKKMLFALVLVWKSPVTAVKIDIRGWSCYKQQRLSTGLDSRMPCQYRCHGIVAIEHLQRGDKVIGSNGEAVPCVTIG